jgi:DNA-directed RNA polymerase beta subunit
MVSLISQKIIDAYFRNDDKQSTIVSHHIDSFNYFTGHGIKKIFMDNNPVRISNFKNIRKEDSGDKDIGNFIQKHYYDVYLGGKDGRLIKIGRDNKKMYPNEARLQNKTYGFKVEYGIEIYDIYTDVTGLKTELMVFDSKENEFIKLGTFPLMLRSKECILSDKTRQECYTKYQECRNDFGGYFIVDGKEKIIVSQDEANRNMIQIENLNEDEVKIDNEEMNDNLDMFDRSDRETPKTNYTFAATIFSQSSNTSKVSRKLKIYMVDPVVSSDYVTRLNGQICVELVYFKQNDKIKPIPLFILMRALGMTSDESIIEACLIDTEKYSNYIEYFRASIYDANCCYTQRDAIEYLKPYTKYKHTENVLHIFTYDLLPHLDDSENPEEIHFLKKAMYIGYMVKQMLIAKHGKLKQMGKDNYIMKRVLLTGTLLYDLFAGFYKKQVLQIRKMFEYKIKRLDSERVPDEILDDVMPDDSIPEDEEEDTRIGFENVDFIDVQKVSTQYDFDRLFDLNTTYGGDRTKLLFDLKVALTSRKWVDSEDEYNNQKDKVRNLCVNEGILSAFHGKWGYDDYSKKDGIVQTLERLSWNKFMSQLKRVNTPVAEKIKSNTVPPHLLHATHYGYIDPVDTPDGSEIGINKHLTIMAKISPFDVYNDSNVVKTEILKNIGDVKWTDKYMYPMYTELRKVTTKLFINGNWVMILFFDPSIIDDTPMRLVNKIRNTMKLDPDNNNSLKYMSISFDYNANEIYIYTSPGRLCRPLFYNLKESNGVQFSWEPVAANPNAELKKWHHISNARLIEYVDPLQENVSLILSANVEKDTLSKLDYYTHMEIDPSLLFGIMGNQIVYPEHNQLPRNIFSCGQSTQTSSLYHSNYQDRFDKMGIVLNYGQIPLIKTKYLKFINHEEQPYGLNAIVAIMCYTGYNVEDAVLINSGAVDRGLFRISYFSSYEAICYDTSTERMDIIKPSEEDFKNKTTEDKEKYADIQSDGFIKLGSDVNEDSILISVCITNIKTNEKTYKPIKAKMGQTGHVDKIGLFYGPDNCKIGRVKICQDRKPQLGDKFSSRHGQKGTVGLLVKEENMPFTKEGLRPDIIINPHAIPSRMTIGQLLESVRGILGLTMGSFCDGTAFQNKDSKNETCSKLLLNNNFSAYGEDTLYNGFTGEQIRSNIFIGPTYYMRLKHMTRDKVQSRSGPKVDKKLQVDQITRQPTHGRSTGGGQKLGEMETIAVVAHGISHFLKESFTSRTDGATYAICNKSGEFAIQTSKKNPYLFSNYVDGPIVFPENTTEHDILNAEKSILSRISKEGRSFSYVEISTSLKVLLHELKVLNITARLITEENFSHMESLSPSKKYDRRNLKKETKEAEDENEMNVNVLINFTNSCIDSLKSLMPSYLHNNYFKKLPKYRESFIKICNLCMSYIKKLPEELLSSAYYKAFHSLCSRILNEKYDLIQRAWTKCLEQEDKRVQRGGGSDEDEKEEVTSNKEPEKEEEVTSNKEPEKEEEEVTSNKEPEKEEEEVTSNKEPEKEEEEEEKEQQQEPPQEQHQEPQPSQEQEAVKETEKGEEITIATPTEKEKEEMNLDIIDLGPKEETKQDNTLHYPEWFEKLNDSNKTKILSYPSSVQTALLSKIEDKLTHVDNAASSELDILKPSEVPEIETPEDTKDIKQISI